MIYFEYFWKPIINYFRLTVRTLVVDHSTYCSNCSQRNYQNPFYNPNDISQITNSLDLIICFTVFHFQWHVPYLKYVAKTDLIIKYNLITFCPLKWMATGPPPTISTIYPFQLQSIPNLTNSLSIPIGKYVYFITYLPILIT